MAGRFIIYALTLIGVALLIPFDLRIAALIDGIELRGDVRRELQALQQYGQISVTAIVGVLIWRLEPARLRRLFDLAMATGVTAVVAYLIKHLTGRARPVYGEPWTFVGPFGVFDPAGGAEPITVWTDRYALGSMPSSHAAAAVVLSVFIATLYPRLRGFAIVMASIVAACRMLFGSHYASDVLAGALLGVLIGGTIIRTSAGVRLADRVRRRPAAPENRIRR